MAIITPIPRADQRVEPWANGAGTTTVVLREPDTDAWRVRVSVARVEHDGPFSELPDTRRTLIPLDAAMILRFADGHELHARRFGTLQFDGAPAPTGLLPNGPTRDFNLMLRGAARGEVLARPLVDSMLLATAAGMRWLVYLDSGHATLRAGQTDRLTLEPGDAARVAAVPGMTAPTLAGNGEIVLVKLYA